MSSSNGPRIIPLEEGWNNEIKAKVSHEQGMHREQGLNSILFVIRRLHSSNYTCIAFRIFLKLTHFPRVHPRRLLTNSKKCWKGA